MAIIERSFAQKSDEWFKARLGNPGASDFKKIITSGGDASKSRIDLLDDLAAQRVRGKADNVFQSKAMENGNIKEDEARKTFALIKDVEVEQVGMVYKDERKLYHASPDGLISNNCGLEIKCPEAGTQTKRLRERKLPIEYFTQVQGNLLVSERDYWWFMSYCDGMNPFIIRVDRDESFIKKLQIELEIFCQELDEITERIR